MKKLFCLLLSLILLLSCLQGMTFAATVIATVETPGKAVVNATSVSQMTQAVSSSGESVVTLKSNVSASSAITFSYSCTIDLNNFTIDLDVTNDVPSEDRNIPYYGAFNVSRHWIRDRYTQQVSFSGFMILPGSESMSMSHHARSGSFVSSGEDYEARFFSLLDNTADGDAVYIQFESEAQYWEFIGGINELMGRWEGGARGSFNYALSHLDEFQVCRVLVSFI